VIERSVSSLSMPADPGSAVRSDLSGATGLEGGRVLSSAVRVAPTGWWVVVEQPISEALGPVFDALLRTIAFLGVGLLLAFLASYLLARMLAAPILRLQRGAARIGAGDLAARIEVQSDDEIGALAAEFNRMASQLQEYTSGLEHKVTEKTEQLERANRHKSEFLASMSHELRTPLNAVIGFSEALKEEYFGPLNEKQKEYVQDINASGQHLLALIGDILDLSKVEAGKMEIEPAYFDLKSMLTNAVTLVRERAVRQGLSVAVLVDEGLGSVYADERKVKQVVINLLSNAVKFTHLHGRVLITARRDKNNVLVSVADTGPGIAAEDQAAIFEEFRQLKASGSAKHEGTGLGLALAKRLVELHGGRIYVESEPGRGAAFTFSLPQPADAPRAQ
jgi:signal transduction histidine kinase